MSKLAIGVLIVGVVLSFHSTLWLWATVAMLVWLGLVVLEMKMNPSLWR